MPQEILQNTEYTTDLTEWGLTTGWDFVGDTATHELCNEGSIYLDTIDFELIPGEEYELSFEIVSISGGYVRAFAGTTASATFHTTSGFKTETITAAGTNPEFRFFSNADLVIKVFNIRGTFQDTSLKQTNSIAFSEKNNKWTDYRTFNPDIAFSMFTRLYSFKRGVMYVHNPESGLRNNFYGEEYQSIIKFVMNGQPGETKTFQSIEYKANTLLITTEDGITTNLGQVSDLQAIDFEQYVLDDGIDAVQVYDLEGNYQAGFLRDKNEDINEGSLLRGNYMIIELVTTESVVLKLFMVGVKSSKSFS